MLNRVFLIGNLGRDPEMASTPGGKALTKFSLAVSRIQRNKETSENQKETEWFTIVAWDHLAETCHHYLHKGSKVWIEGRIQSHKYTDKSGVERTAWEVIATEMHMLDPKRERSGGSGESASPEEAPF